MLHASPQNRGSFTLFPAHRDLDDVVFFGSLGCGWSELVVHVARFDIDALLSSPMPQKHISILCH